MRNTAVAQMIIDATAARTFLLIGIAYAFHVAVVVIGPYKGYILRYTESGIIYVKCLLIRYKDLLNLIS